VQSTIVSALILTAAVLFAREVWTIDIITLVMVLALIATGILTPAEAFAGFASEIIVVLAALFVVTGALQDTGVVDVATARLFRSSPRGPAKLTAMLMGIVSALSSVMNNTTVTGLLVGPATALAQRVGVAPSRLLMPLAFASMIGGTCTLIGTSTNIAVNGRLSNHGLEPLGFFEITPLGIALALVGIAWMALVGRRFLPDRPTAANEGATIADGYLSEMLVLPDSPLAGKRLGECGFANRGIRVVRIVRGDDFVSARGGRKLVAGDVLLFVGDANALMEVKAMEGIEIRPEVKLGSIKGALEQERVAEAVVLPDSRLVGSTLRDVALYDASGAVVLGLHRRGRQVHQPLVDIEVRGGDVLLIQGDAEALALAQEHYALAFTSAVVRTSRLRRNRGWLVAASFLLAIAMAASELVPLSVCFLAAAVLTVVSRCVESERALEHVPWRLLILIGGMTAFGTAVQKSGADQVYAGLIETWLAPYGALPVLGGFMILTMLLSQTMSNAAAALVVLPVAVATAQRLGLDPRPFAVGIMVASSLALATPFEPSCVLVFGPGRYRFRDFYVVGLPLSLVLLLTALFLVPLLWPLHRT
jgi:di/tricarboxylate transporter